MKRYRCEKKHSFSVDFRPKEAPLWKSFVAGDSLRGLAERHDLTSGAIAKRLKRELAALPRNEEITKQYCTRFGDVICVDGVYVLVKGFAKKIPFIYGIDYPTHDIPAGILDFAENEAAFVRLFLMWRDAGYQPTIVVADEAPALPGALCKVFPDARVQLCHVHILRNIRETLSISRRDETHLPFFRSMQKLLAMRGEENRRTFFQTMALSQTVRDGEWEILKSIRSRWDDLFRYESIQKQGISCPTTNNLIEGYNHHFKDRMRGIKGFESIASAERFLNAWMIKRRIQPFRDCGERFKHLNGKSSFDQSRNPELPYPDILL